MCEDKHMVRARKGATIPRSLSWTVDVHSVSDAAISKLWLHGSIIGGPDVVLCDLELL